MLKDEGASPRGRITLIQTLSENKLRPSKRAKKLVSQCLLCTACVSVCPNNVRTDLLILYARERLREQPGSRIIDAVLDKVVFSRTAVSFRLASAVEHAVGRRLASGSGTFYRVPGSRTVPEIKGSSFSGSADNAYRQKTNTGLFLGCLIDFVNHDVAADAVKLLEASGKRPYLPVGQACCGLPAFSAGDTKKAARQATAAMAPFDDTDTIVTACGSCGSMMKNYYPLLFDSPADKARAEAFSKKIKDISEVIDPGTIERAEGVGGTITYHDPCHLKRGMSVSEKPRDLIRKAGYTILEMERSDRCCGLGGAFNIKHRRISSVITGDKVKDIKSTGATIVATGCPGCMANIGSMIAEDGADIRVVHTVSLLLHAGKARSTIVSQPEKNVF
ncbi:MAG: (Fe-S)-binding protein [Deltaproteobacteria bacterium]|nr:(Fe-S)-binding protein [Deltaproteobacteria bacterium]